jgi:acetyl-CoA carboxylase biotin carboxyl carrier protein
MALRTIKAEIAGTIIAVEKNVGDAVEMDDIVLFMESMKMEMPVTAPAAGRVAVVVVADGDTVTEGQVLARIET